jgi:ubiquinone/menaquinone biosynthesis C-methylase UbiE
MDPSSVMLEQGKAKLGDKSESGCSIDWKVGTAENMPWIGDESVDLVVSGETALVL